MLRKLDFDLLAVMDIWLRLLHRWKIRQRSFECMLVGLYIGFAPRVFFRMPWILGVILITLALVYQMSTSAAQRILVIRWLPALFRARMLVLAIFISGSVLSIAVAARDHSLTPLMNIVQFALLMILEYSCSTAVIELDIIISK